MLPKSLGAPAEFGRSRQRQPCNSPVSSLGAPAEFGRSRQKQQESPPLGGDDMYLHAYICVLVCQY